MINESKDFSKWRKRLWPIHGSELKKFIPLLIMKCCISFNFTLLHAAKDTIIVTTKGSGAEAIPILKGWVVLLFAFIWMLVYSKLSNHLSKKNLFYATLSPFIIFFALYGFLLFPNRDWLSPHQTADWLVSIVGEERSHWVVVFRYWMDSLFYLMAEFWGGVVVFVLYWGFLNQISTINEASRFYTLLSAGGHIGVIISGPLIWHFAHSQEQYAVNIQMLMSIAIIVSLLIMALYWWLNRYVVFEPINEVSPSSKPKYKMSLKEGLMHVVMNPALGCIAMMVVGYGLSTNLVEVAWKGMLKIQYPDSKDYQAFTGIFMSVTGVVSLILTIFVSGNLIRSFGWHAGAQSTPVVLGLASAAFYALYFISAHSSGTWLPLLVICGAIHSVACKSMKFCFFDPTKEMAYIPLDDESKVKGKAAVDLIGARFGKSGSSWIQLALMEAAGVGSVLYIIPYLIPIVFLTIIGWSTAVYLLSAKTPGVKSVVSTA